MGGTSFPRSLSPSTTIWDEWARDKDGAVPDDLYGDDENSHDIGESSRGGVRIKTALPGFAHEFGSHDEARCANDLSFSLFGSDEYIAEVFPEPAGEHVIRAVGGIAALVGDDWRIGRGSLVRLVKYDFSDSVPIPLAEDVMFAWLSDLGWKPKLSPAGLLAKQIYRQLEGQISVFHDEAVLGLLEHMNGGEVQRDGKPVADGTVQAELERDLPVGEVKSRSGSSYEHLLARGVFRLGNRMQCPNCLRHSWFALNLLGDTLTCPRCSRAFPAIRSLTNGTWTYKTTGPFSVPGYAEGAYAVLLTLAFFSNRKMGTFHTTPVMSFTAVSPQKKDLEADYPAPPTIAQHRQRAGSADQPVGVEDSFLATPFFWAGC